MSKQPDIGTASLGDLIAALRENTLSAGDLADWATKARPRRRF